MGRISRCQLSSRESGQALVELAIVIPVLLLLLFGIIEFGRAFHSYLVVNEAAREGARVGAVGASNADIVTVVTAASAASVDTTKLTIVVTPEEGSRVRGQSIQVVVSYPVPINTPLISDLVGNPLPVFGRAVMRLE